MSERVKFFYQGAGWCLLAGAVPLLLTDHPIAAGGAALAGIGSIFLSDRVYCFSNEVFDAAAKTINAFEEYNFYRTQEELTVSLPSADGWFSPEKRLRFVFDTSHEREQGIGTILLSHVERLDHEYSFASKRFVDEVTETLSGPAIPHEAQAVAGQFVALRRRVALRNGASLWRDAHP